MAYPKVTIVGAGNVGATAAELILFKNLADVVLIDVVEGVPQGKALDMMHMRSLAKFGPVVTGTNDYADTAGSDVVVITAGVPRKPGMTREDLLDTNSKIMRSVIEQVQAASPDAIIICVTNPLDVMTYLAKQISGLPKERIFGMGGVLDSSRFAFAIQQTLDCDIADVDAIVVGAHGQGMVPLPKHSSVAGKPLTELLDADAIAAVCERTVNGGAEVVNYLKTGSAFYAPGASIARMVEAILTDSHDVLSVCAYLEGEYGIDDIYMCVPVELAREGIVRVVEFDLDDEDKALLAESAASIRASVEALS
ncbi:MAG: malate dehydrogenase [Coriobacteriales bacterium]|jgi:malate dehydrogenase